MDLVSSDIGRLRLVSSRLGKLGLLSTSQRIKISASEVKKDSERDGDRSFIVLLFFFSLLLHFALASFCVLADIAVFAAAPILCKTSPFYFDLGIPFRLVVRTSV